MACRDRADAGEWGRARAKVSDGERAKPGRRRRKRDGDARRRDASPIAAERRCEKKRGEATRRATAAAVSIDRRRGRGRDARGFATRDVDATRAPLRVDGDSCGVRRGEEPLACGRARGREPSRAVSEPLVPPRVSDEIAIATSSASRHQSIWGFYEPRETRARVTTDDGRATTKKREHAIPPTFPSSMTLRYRRAIQTTAPSSFRPLLPPPAVAPSVADRPKSEGVVTSRRGSPRGRSPTTPPAPPTSPPEYR